MDTPNTRSRTKRENETSVLASKGASQEEPRVLWECDRRFKREFLSNIKDDEFPIPMPTQRPAPPHISTSASNRPRKRLKKNRSLPSGSSATVEESTIRPHSHSIDDSSSASTSSDVAGRGSGTGETELDRLLLQYQAVRLSNHHYTPILSRVLPTPQSDLDGDVDMTSLSNPKGILQPSSSPNQSHHPSSSKLPHQDSETPLKRKSAPSRSSITANPALHPAKSIRNTPTRAAALRAAAIKACLPSPSSSSTSSQNKSNTSPLPLPKLSLSQSRRLGPSLSQGEISKSLGAPPRIGLRSTTSTTDATSSLVSSQKAFKPPIRVTETTATRSSPRRHSNSSIINSSTPRKTNTGVLRSITGQTTAPKPSPLRISRGPSTSGQSGKQTNPSAVVTIPKLHVGMGLSKVEDKMPSSDGPGTGDESFDSIDFGTGGDDVAALLRAVDGF